MGRETMVWSADLWLTATGTTSRLVRPLRVSTRLVLLRITICVATVGCKTTWQKCSADADCCPVHGASKVCCVGSKLHPAAGKVCNFDVPHEKSGDCSNRTLATPPSLGGGI